MKSFKLGGRLVEPTNHGVAVGGVVTRLRPTAWNVLMVLVERRGEIVSIDALLEAVWRDQNGEPAYVRKAVYEIRAALGDDDQRIVRTLPRVGYIIESVAVDEGGESAEPAASPLPPRGEALVYRTLSSDTYESISRRLRRSDRNEES